MLGVTWLRARCKSLGTTASIVLVHAALVAPLPAQSAPDDTARTHSALRERIAEFELGWYRAWETAQLERRFSSPKAGAPRRNGRRSAALACQAQTPIFPPIGPVRVWVTGPVDLGAVCPIWYPPDDDIPPDEGESIDLALSVIDSRPVRAARDTLLRRLATSEREHPHDAWITGQHVRFLIDQQRVAEARGVADACRGDVRSCTDLRALTRYVAGDLLGADSLLRESDALAEAARPAGTSCLPTDVSVLFDSKHASEINDAGCADQQRLGASLFFLADPFFALAGNERYVAHGIRRIHTALRAIDERDERYVWTPRAGGDALKRTVLRYGWPSHTYWPGWEYERNLGKRIETSLLANGFITEGFNVRPLSETARLGGRIFPKVSPLPHRQFIGPYTVKEYTADRTALVPAFAALKDPFSLVPSHYDLNNPDPRAPDAWWPHEHMRLAATIRPMPSGQDIVLRRDSANRFVLAIEDPLRGDVTDVARAQAVLVGGQSEGTLRLIAESEAARGQVLRLDGRISGDPLVASAEVFVSASPISALRMRYGVRPPPVLEALPLDSIALSPPLFLRMPRGATALPIDPESAISAMAGTRTFSKEVPLVVYWESYGLARVDTVEVSVTIRRNDDRSRARVAGSTLGLVSDLRDSISVRWTEPDGRNVTVVPGARVIMGRALSLDVGNLPAGDYMLELQMEHARKGTARSSRGFTLTMER